MVQKKVCMVGAFGVGKTSLVQRIVEGIFSEKYLTTVGVKIDKAVVELPSAGPVSLILWDLAGEDRLHSFNLNFLTGATGLVYVIDTTRRGTFEVALDLKQRIAPLGQVPAIALLNKSDLPEQNELTKADFARASAEFPHLLPSSAKTGLNVVECFHTLTTEMHALGDVRLQRPRGPAPV